MTVLPGPPSRLWVPITRTSASAAAASSSLDAAWPSRRTPEIDSSGASVRASARAWSSSSWPCSGRAGRALPGPRRGTCRCGRPAGWRPSIVGQPGGAGQRRGAPGRPVDANDDGGRGLAGAARAADHHQRAGRGAGQVEADRSGNVPQHAAEPAAADHQEAGVTGRIAQHRSREPGFHDPFDAGIRLPAASPGPAGRGRAVGGRSRARSRPCAAARAVRARSTPSARTASAECRSPLPSTPLTGPSFLVKMGQTQAWTTRSRYLPAAAYSAAHRTAVLRGLGPVVAHCHGGALVPCGGCRHASSRSAVSASGRHFAPSRTHGARKGLGALVPRVARLRGRGRAAASVAASGRPRRCFVHAVRGRAGCPPLRAPAACRSAWCPGAAAGWFPRLRCRPGAGGRVPFRRRTRRRTAATC